MSLSGNEGKAFGTTSEISSVSRLGDIGGAVHPVGNGSPVILWYRLDQVPQAGALADGDREADIHFPAGGNDSVGVDAAVGPHRELVHCTPYLRLRNDGFSKTSPCPKQLQGLKSQRP